MLGYANERETNRNKEAWRRSLIITQAAINGYIKRPKSLTYLADKIMKDDSDGESSDEVKRTIREAHELAQQRARSK